MPYTYFGKTTGSTNGTVLAQQLGWKLIPHIKEQRLDKPYSLSYWQFLDGNTEKLNMRAGGTFWGETTPAHEYPGSVQDNSMSFGTLGNLAYARAYTKFKDKVYTQASNLTAVKERGKTIEMVVSRLAQLKKGALALKRGRFKEFLRTFGVKPKPKHVHQKWSRPQDFGKLWLEYWMGWAPTVGDVYTTLEFLGSPIPDNPVRSGSTVPMSGSQTKTDSSGAKATCTWQGECTVWIKAKVVLTNPSLFNLNGLGLLNPAKTLWETTPFSWFVDWFLNVGQVLGQVTDWLGLELKDLVVSCKTEYDHSYHVSNPYWILGSQAPNPTWRKRKFTGFSRKTGGTLPVVKPLVRVPNELSLTRGATLVSLLVTMFSPKRVNTI